MMHLVIAALIALATLVLLAYATCREAPHRRLHARAWRDVRKRVE